MRKRSGQSILEYSILFIIVVAAFLTMQGYVKRGFQGRWRSSADDMGPQYDPRTTNMEIRHTITSYSNTELEVVDPDDEDQAAYTMRTDQSSTRETRKGYTRTGMDR